MHHVTSMHTIYLLNHLRVYLIIIEYIVWSHVFSKVKVCGKSNVVVCGKSTLLLICELRSEEHYVTE